MIEVDISHVWGRLSLPQLLEVERHIAAAHEMVTEGTDTGSDFSGWLDLPGILPQEELARMEAAAETIRRDSDVCVVVGTGGALLGARAAIDLLQGSDRNRGRGKGDPEILFAGDSLSTRQWAALMRQLEGRDVSVIVISKTSDTLECGIAFRALRWLLERRYGTDEAHRRITVVTDPEAGSLRQMSREEGWQSFAIPADVPEPYALLCPAGLLPMAVAGIDIRAVVRGAEREKQAYNLRSFENPVWLYAGVRNALHSSGTALELLSFCEPEVASFGAWWQQLFATSQGKEERGLFPVYGAFPGGLHSLGQMIQQGRKNLLETMIRFTESDAEIAIGQDVKNLDGLNYLTGKTLNYVNQQAFQAALEAHADGGVPVITMDCGELTAETLGEVFYFFSLSSAVSAYALGVNPYDQSGMQNYSDNLHRLLGRPLSQEKCERNSQI